MIWEEEIEDFVGIDDGNEEVYKVCLESWIWWRCVVWEKFREYVEFMDLELDLYLEDRIIRDEG